jgi:polar amino acid transport system ATP-binding protein
MPIVRVSDACKSFGPLAVLKGVSLDVERGQVVVLIGRSGSGKSTLLRCVNGLETIDSGAIEIAGHVLGSKTLNKRQLHQDVGIVFQSYNLFPHLSVTRNIMLALTVVKRMPRAKAEEVAHDALRQVGLFEKRNDFPDHLSGGQQQRVAIARSLAMDPKVMLFDEVTSALDPELKDEVLKVIEGLAQRGITMILVTHEMVFARKVADTLVFMHEGKIQEMGEPERLFAQPQSAELRQFISTAISH